MSELVAWIDAWALTPALSAEEYSLRAGELDDAFDELEFDPRARMCPSIRKVRTDDDRGPFVPECSLAWWRSHNRVQRVLHRAARHREWPDETTLVVDADDAATADPHWCQSCAGEIRKAIASLPDLAAGLWEIGHEATPTLRVVSSRVQAFTSPGGRPLTDVERERSLWWKETLACGHELTSPAPKPGMPWPLARKCWRCALVSDVGQVGSLAPAAAPGRRTRSSVVAPSLSPSYDAIEEITSWVGQLDDNIRGRLGQRPLGEAWWEGDVTTRSSRLSTMVGWLTTPVPFATLMAAPFAVEVGREAISMAERAERASGRDELTHRLDARCPRCDRRSLERDDGAAEVRCRRCKESWPEAAYAWLVRLQAEEAGGA